MAQTIANVKDFGAAGDGVTDDTTAIQNAINALVNGGSGYSPGGGTLYFPYGVYRVVPVAPSKEYPTRFVPVGNVELNAAVWVSGSNITLQGDGVGSIIHQDGNSANWDERPWCIPFCFSFGTALSGLNPLDLSQKLFQYPEFNTGNILIKDLTFRGNISPKLMPLDVNGTVNSVRGIGAFLAFIGAPKCFARGIRIVNCVFEDANKSTAICPLWVDDIQFENCTFTACKDFIIGTNVRAAATRDIDLGDDNELMNLSQGGPWDLWAEDFIDGVGVVTGDHALLINQTDARDNGPYLVRDDFKWERAPEMQTQIDADSMYRADQGRTNGLRIFQLQRTQPPIYISGSASTPKYFYEFVNVINATTRLCSLTGYDPIDGNVNRLGDPILVKDQINQDENGIYEYNPIGRWKKLQNINLVVRIRLGNMNASLNGGAARYFRSESTPTFVEITSPETEIGGNPIGFARIRATSQTNVQLTPVSGMIGLNPIYNTFSPSTSIIDGVPLNYGDSVLLAAQTTRAQNGLYIYTGAFVPAFKFTDSQDANNVTEFYLSGGHYTVTAGVTLAGQHFANRTPIRIAVGASSQCFNRAHAFLWAVTCTTTARLSTLAGLQIIDGVQVRTGDLVLVRHQHAGQSDQVTAARANGVYVAQIGQWARASFDPGPDEPNREFNVSVWHGTQPEQQLLFVWSRQNGLDVTPSDPNNWVIRNTYYAAENCRPQIHGFSPVGNLKMIGNTCDCDYIRTGTRWGSDGLSWVAGNGGTTLNGGVTIASNNVIKNYRFEAFQPATKVTVVTNNSFYSRKIGPSALTLGGSSPGPGENTVFSMTLSNNDVDGGRLIVTSHGALRLNDVDVEIVGNTVRGSGDPNLPSPTCEIVRGRRVTIANNVFDRPAAWAILAGSCTTSLAIVARTGLSTIQLSDLGTLKSGDKIMFWANPASGLATAGIDVKAYYFAKIESGTTISVYTDSALTKPISIVGNFPAGALVYYRLDSVLSITGNTITNFAPVLGFQNVTVQVGGGANLFGQIVISNNVIAGSYHIAINTPNAGTNFVTIGDNIYMDSSNTAFDPTLAQYPKIDVANLAATASDAFGRTIIQWGMNATDPLGVQAANTIHRYP